MICSRIRPIARRKTGVFRRPAGRPRWSASLTGARHTGGTPFALTRPAGQFGADWSTILVDPLSGLSIAGDMAQLFSSITKQFVSFGIAAHASGIAAADMLPPPIWNFCQSISANRFPSVSAVMMMAPEEEESGTMDLVRQRGGQADKSTKNARLLHCHHRAPKQKLVVLAFRRRPSSRAGNVQP